jgi:hypothetical protein
MLLAPNALYIAAASTVRLGAVQLTLFGSQLVAPVLGARLQAGAWNRCMESMRPGQDASGAGSHTPSHHEAEHHLLNVLIAQSRLEIDPQARDDLQIVSEHGDRACSLATSIARPCPPRRHRNCGRSPSRPASPALDCHSGARWTAAHWRKDERVSVVVIQRWAALDRINCSGGRQDARSSARADPSLHWWMLRAAEPES